jgi:hypothetical protein
LSFKLNISVMASVPVKGASESAKGFYHRERRVHRVSA